MRLPLGDFDNVTTQLGTLKPGCFGYANVEDLHTDGTLLFLPRSTVVYIQCTNPVQQMRIQNVSKNYPAYRAVLLDVHYINWQLKYRQPDPSFICLTSIGSVHNNTTYTGLDVGLTGPALQDLQLYQSAYIDASALRVATMGEDQHYFAPEGGQSLVLGKPTASCWLVQRREDGFYLRTFKGWAQLHF